ncbi:MAG TPA: sulfotransferase domain-containing protein [Chthoniobacterales bacterium]|nr:sulfotransferase domain-containing protein [Chthoniobacterales bacterium]
MILKSRHNPIERLDFIIAGAQKAGTSALADFLETHPRIQMPHKDELHRTVQPARHFFDDEERFAKREVDYSPLQRGCVRKRPSNLLGSCTPIYIYWKTALERIRNYSERVKLIILLRDPSSRAFSHWNMQRDRNLESLDFLDAVRAEKQRAEEVRPFQLRKYSYVDRGFYGDQMERVFRVFRREQVQVIKFEDFRRNPRRTLDETCRFLGIELLCKIDNRENNSTPYARKMTRSERQTLVDLYRADIERLEELLGWDCSDWKKV